MKINILQVHQDLTKVMEANKRGEVEEEKGRPKNAKKENGKQERERKEGEERRKAKQKKNKYISIYIYMASLLTKLDPRNINWHKSPHKVTSEISAKNDAKIDELEKEQKLLKSKLKRGVYKSDADFKQAWEHQNNSFQRILDHRDAWDETTSRHPRVNKQREIEKDRFMGNAIAIQNKYDNVISEQAQKQGVCGYLSEKTCSKGKDCYWFGKEDVDGKDVGCYSRKEPRKNWSVPQPIRRSKATTLGTIQENPVASNATCN